MKQRVLSRSASSRKGYLVDYKARHAKSSNFARYAIGRVKRLVGAALVAEVNERALPDYRTTRLNEKASERCLVYAPL
jgi:hypothetical protein